MTAIDHALRILEELGAISDTGELTPLGQNLVSATRQYNATRSLKGVGYDTC